MLPPEDRLPAIPGTGRLAGRRVLLARTPSRSAAMTDALRREGADVALLPLIDFERGPDTEALSAALENVLCNGFEWIVFSSATALAAVEDALSAKGMRAAVLAGRARIAAVGAGTAAALARAGLSVDLVPPVEQSAAGLLDVWASTGARILLPQADLAADTLRLGLSAAGNTVTAVAAYRTVDYPARPAHRLTGHPNDSRGPARPDRGGCEVLSLDSARATVVHGRMDAVVVPSPSAARRIAERLTPLGNCRVVAIGPATALAARELGLDVAATAPKPTPAGIVAATIEAFAATKEKP